MISKIALKGFKLLYKSYWSLGGSTPCSAIGWGG